MRVPPAPLTIRPLRPGDRRTTRAIYAGLSSQSRSLRFHTGTAELSEGMLARLTDVRPDQHVAFVAYHGESPIGMGRWIRLRGGAAADLSLEVADAWQGRGVGRALVHALAENAATADIVEFAVDVAPEHRRLRATLAAAGAAAGPDRHEFVVSVAAVLGHLRGYRTVA